MIKDQDHDLYQRKMIMINKKLVMIMIIEKLFLIMINLIMIIGKDRSKIRIKFQITIAKLIKYSLIITFYGSVFRLESGEQYLVGNSPLLTCILASRVPQSHKGQESNMIKLNFLWSSA